MTGTIRRNLVTKFQHLLKEGGVYNIANFKVVSNSGNYRPVDSMFKMVFTLLTTVKKTTNVPTIPMNSFQFVGQKLINDRIENDSILTGIII